MTVFIFQCLNPRIGQHIKSNKGLVLNLTPYYFFFAKKTATLTPSLIML